jgi:hypothetical protein
VTRPKGLIARAAVALAILPVIASCASVQHAGGLAPDSTSATGIATTSRTPVPAGSVPATPQPPSNVATHPVDSGVSVGIGSNTPQAVYEARIAVTVTSQPNAVSPSSSGPATEIEVAHVKVQVQSGTYVLKPTDFMFLGADGNVYPPTTSASVGNTLQPATVKAGRSAERDIAFRVPPGGGLVQLYNELGPESAWRTTT